MKTRYLIPLLLLLPLVAEAQSYRTRVNDANEAYNQQKYDLARDGYSKAAAEDPERPEGWFNHGNAAYRSDDIQAALRQYEQAGKRARSKEELAGTLYNAGNVFLNAAEKGADNPALKQAAGDDPAKLKMEGYKQAIELYKKSLKLQPSDGDARYNLAYAKKKLEELQQQSKNQQQNKDQKQDKNKDQENKDKDKKDEQQKKDQQKKDQEEKQKQDQKDQQNKDQAKPDEKQQQKQQKQPQMSKQQAEQILRALERQEKDLQKQKREEVPVRVSVEKDW